MSKLISIITPTYNCGHVIHRLLDSVLQQTYSNIEMFVIDDGSTDTTKQVIAEYYEKFHTRGFIFNYIYQKNQGQSVAINNGLKLIHGDYLVWPDADDFYAEPAALLELAEALDNSPADVSMVRAFQYLIDEKLKVIGEHSTILTKENLFEDCLWAINEFWFGAGVFMVKTHILFALLPDYGIFTAKDAGQNWQLLLPALYNYRCITIKKYLYNVLERNNSHSRTVISYEQSLNRHNTFLSVLISTLNNIKSMPEKEKSFLIYRLKCKYSNLLFMVHFSFGNIKEAKTLFKKMLAENMTMPIRIKIYYRLCFIPFGITFYKVLKKIRSMIA